MPKKKSGQTVHSLSTLPYYAVVYHKNTPSARVFSRKMAGFSGIFASNGGKADGVPVRAACSACQKRAVPFFDKLSKHFQNLHKSSENAVIENERHP